MIEKSKIDELIQEFDMVNVVRETMTVGSKFLARIENHPANLELANAYARTIATRALAAVIGSDLIHTPLEDLSDLNDVVFAEVQLLIERVKEKYANNQPK